MLLFMTKKSTSKTPDSKDESWSLIIFVLKDLDHPSIKVITILYSPMFLCAPTFVIIDIELFSLGVHAP